MEDTRNGAPAANAPATNNQEGASGSSTGGLASNILQDFFAPSNKGNRNYYNGVPLILRGPQYTKSVNKVARVIQAMPRQKFLFYANFNPSPATGIEMKDMSSVQTGFAFQISKIDRPKATPTLKELRQYNRKRLVQTGIEFGDLNVTMHDTVDDRVLRVWQAYYKWYFGEGRMADKKKTAWTSNVIDQLDTTAAAQWGFSPPNASNTLSNTNFFDSLDIYTFYGKRYTQVRVYNPKISGMEFEAMDSEGTTLTTCSFTIKPEGIEYINTGEIISSTEIVLFNLNTGDYYEPSDLFGGVNAGLMRISDQLENGIDNLLTNISSIPFVGGALAGAAGKFINGTGIAGFPMKIAQKLSTGNLTKWGKFF